MSDEKNGEEKALNILMQRPAKELANKLFEVGRQTIQYQKEIKDFQKKISNLEEEKEQLEQNLEKLRNENKSNLEKCESLTQVNQIQKSTIKVYL
jgi:ubiquinone biosynthesis protein UbiJ